MNKKILTIFASLAMVLGLGLGMTAPASAASTSNCVIGTGGLKGGLGCATPEDVPTTIFGDGGIFNKVTNILLFLIGSLSVIMIIVGAIRYVISAGDAKQVESAKNTILYAIIGLILAILAFAIISFVTGVFVI